mgnify:CR=1 FL=1
MSNESRSLSITHSPLSSAVWTGLEPATPCVTGRYSNQLNYHTIWDLCRSSIIMIFRPVLFRLPCGSCLNLCFNVLVASSVISFLHCKGKSFFWTVQISVDILTNFYTIIFCKIAVTRVCRGYKHPIYYYISTLYFGIMLIDVGTCRGMSAFSSNRKCKA